MGIEVDKVKVAVEEVKESNPGPDGASVVVETESVVNGELRDTSIEVRETDAPAVAQHVGVPAAFHHGPVGVVPVHGHQHAAPA